LIAPRLLKSPPLVAALIFSIAWVAALFLLQRHFGFNIADGGFLWYGAERTLAGDVPLRDFMAYDPGRYWLAAMFMAAVHDTGMIAMRAWMYLVEAVGVCIVVVTVARSRSGGGFIQWCVVALIASFWMYPEHKTIDILMSIAIVLVLSLLIEKPSAARFFWTGVYVGASAVIGRNHGLYGVVACLLTIILLGVKRRHQFSLVRRAAYGALGIGVGYLPLIVALFVVPGFGSAFVESVLLNLKANSTNLPLPVPWPWLVNFHALAPLYAAQQFVIGLGFIALPLFSIAGAIRLIRLPADAISMSHPVFAAAVIASIPYQHYAFSRADPTHLTHSIFPVLIGLLCWPARTRWVVPALLLASAIAMLPLMPRLDALRSGDWQLVSVGADTLVVEPNTAQAMRFLQNIDRTYVKPGQTLWVTPLWPAAYPLLNRVAPVWDLYGLFHRDRQFEEAEIKRLQSAPVAVVIVVDGALDGRDDLRFKNTHPLMQQYLEAHYKDLTSTSPAPSLHIYVPDTRGTRSASDPAVRGLQ
jgi:hypothetical protein